MAFYGKVYEQVSNTFDRIQFTNTPEVIDGEEIVFPAELEPQFTIDAVSHGDKIPMVAANGWVQFVQTNDEKGNTLCQVYHSAPKEALKDTGLIIKEIIPGEQYTLAVEDGSTLLTEKEKKQLKELREQGSLLYFGDTMIVSAPKYDAAGHITGQEEKAYTISIMPRFEEFLNSTAGTAKLEEVVGTDNYPEDALPLSSRVLVLEDKTETVENRLESVAAQAALAETANANSNTAVMNAAQAQRTAQEAAEEVGGFEYKLGGVISAVGVTGNSGIINEMGEDIPNLVAWNRYLTEKVNALEAQLSAMQTALNSQ